jgi:hypothetical protein
MTVMTANLFNSIPMRDHQRLVRSKSLSSLLPSTTARSLASLETIPLVGKDFRKLAEVSIPILTNKGKPTYEQVIAFNHEVRKISRHFSEVTEKAEDLQLQNQILLAQQALCQSSRFGFSCAIL